MSTCQNSKLRVQHVCTTLPRMARATVLPPYDKSEVGKRIVLLRAAKQNMAQKALAEAIGITPQKLSNYESGRDLIPVHYAAQLCTVTGANFDYLYRGLMGDLPANLAGALLDAAKPMPERLSRRG